MDKNKDYQDTLDDSKMPAEEVTVVAVDLQAVPVTDQTDPYYRDVDIGYARICLNAQEEYKRTKYCATVLPEGTRAAVTSTGNATVAFAGIEGSDPDNLEDGDEFYVVEDGETGTYEITLTHHDLPTCTATAVGVAFDINLSLHPNVSKGGTSSAHTGTLPDINDWLACSNDGSKNTIYYERDTEIKTNPTGQFTGFDVRGTLRTCCTYEQRAEYLGRTAKNQSFFDTDIWNSPEWILVECVLATAGGPYYSAANTFVSYVSAAGNGKSKHTAVGCGSFYLDVDGSGTYGTAANQGETRISPSLGYALSGNGYPTSPPPPGPDTDPSSMISGSSVPYPFYGDPTTWTDFPIEKQYSAGIPIPFNVGYVVTNESSGPFKRYGPDLLDYWWAGIDINCAKARIRMWTIDSLKYEILSP